MGKVVTAVIVVAGLWVASEFFTQGPENAFGGAFAGVLSNSSEQAVVDDRSTARRSGDSVARAHAEADARRERLLAE